MYDIHIHTAVFRGATFQTSPGSRHWANLPEVGSFENAVSRQFVGWFLVVKHHGFVGVEITKQWVKNMSIIISSHLQHASSRLEMCFCLVGQFKRLHKWCVGAASSKHWSFRVPGILLSFWWFSMTMFYIGMLHPSRVELRTPGCTSSTCSQLTQLTFREDNLGAFVWKHFVQFPDGIQWSNCYYSHVYVTYGLIAVWFSVLEFKTIQKFPKKNTNLIPLINLWKKTVLANSHLAIPLLLLGTITLNRHKSISR